MSEALFLEAFTLWGSPTTWLEIVAVVIALAMVGCNIREIHWGWPLAIISSLMYFALFWRSKLYGEATLQIFFVVVAFWGWFQWLRGHRGDMMDFRGCKNHHPLWIGMEGIAEQEADLFLLRPKINAGALSDVPDHGRLLLTSRLNHRKGRRKWREGEET